jgi:glycosyltransferase involved in cell wall biosynthesis
MVDISIILATRNEREYIGETLRNVLEASDEVERRGVSTEIIVIDNSTDDTFTEAKKYVKNVYRLVPRGVSKARNFGANLAKGSILIFMDADTTLQKSSLADAFEKFRDTTVVSIVARVLPLSQRRTLSTVLFYLLDGLYIRLCAYVNVLIKFYNRGDMTAIRKNIFEKIQGFNERLNMLEITDMLMKASSYGRIRVLSSPVFESSRRLMQWGLLKSYKVWWRNYVCFHILGRLYDSSYEACRGKGTTLLGKGIHHR